MYSNMYLKWPRIIFFFLTTALSIATISLASWGLARLADKRDLVKHLLPGGELHANPILAVGGALTAVSGLASGACLLMLGMMWFAPRREETIGSVRFREGLFAVIAILELGVLIACSIVTFTKSATISVPGLPQQVVDALVAGSGQKLGYRYTAAPVAYTIVGWVMWASTIISLILVSLAARHVLANGHPTTHGAPIMMEGTKASGGRSSLGGTDTGSIKTDIRDKDSV